jgi:hypothetical protein
MADQQAREAAIVEAIVMSDEAPIRASFVEGVGIWERAPGVRHQKAVYRIQTSVTPAAGLGLAAACVHAGDVLVRFPDGSILRPGSAIFSREPDELDDPVTLLPEAVIEVLNQGHHAKDLAVCVPFYRRHGVKDIIVLDPVSKQVLHVRADGERKHTSPVTLSLECGCEVTV